jgi:2',3'-cyclic-nucleotide 2'-phosphodiesterase (5'-nucleotidase family)
VARNQILYLNDEAAELTVVLYHGPSRSAEQLALGVASIDVLILAHEQLLIEPRRVADTIIVSPGEEGNRVGILTLKVDEAGAFEYSHRFQLFSWQDDPDDPAVRGQIDQYKRRLRQRL